MYREFRALLINGAILTNVSKSLHVEGVGYQVSIFEECIGTFASVRKHQFCYVLLWGWYRWVLRVSLDIRFF